MPELPQETTTILIVDDDPHVLDVLEARLLSAGFRIFKAHNGPDALTLLKDNKIDLMLSDMKMPGMSGMEVLVKARAIQPGLPVLILTAYGSISDAVKAVKAGAVDYLAKPFDGRELVQKLRKVLEGAPRIAAIRDEESLVADIDATVSPKMKELYAMVRRVAQSNVNVLILGDSGVGKERIARLLHQLSPRAGKPFVVVDCGSTPAGLLESELFGHVKGAFTGAIREREGRFEAAHGGNIFLDEIGDLPLATQVKLLRVLEEKVLERVGDNRPIGVDVRIISATNRNLAQLIEAGSFREDFFYRINVIPIWMPSLRERREDIPLLAESFFRRVQMKSGKPMKAIGQAALDALMNYHWPGNVRELRSCFEYAVVACPGPSIEPEHLPAQMQTARALRPEPPAGAASLEDLKRQRLVEALRESGGNQSDAARRLGISRTSVWNQMKRFGLSGRGEPLK
jgi:DNA-binding NtrC family response regulator